MPVRHLGRHSFRSLRLSIEELEARETPSAAPGNNILWRSYASSSSFTLHSNPGATKVIYLDFTGHTTSGTSWNTQHNGGAPFTVPAWSMDGNRSAFSTTERDKIILIWRQVSEDFAPFDIDVTTQDPTSAGIIKSTGTDIRYGIRVVIGPDPETIVSNSPTAWPTGAIGIAALNSFGTSKDTPTFINDGDLSPTPEFSMADTISHEVGHTFGLTHDGDATQAYYPGHGSGVTGWGTIMGSPFGMNITQWNNGSYPGANNNQDDLAVITTGHGFTYRPDDVGSTQAGAKLINTAFQTNLPTRYGLIERNSDVDYYKFFANPGPINIDVEPLFTLPNLDVRADLYGPNGQLIMSLNPASTLDVNFNLTLTTKGPHYIAISGGSVAGPLGWTKYGSLGSYKITGTVTPFQPGFETFVTVNPLRWLYSATSRTYSGYITLSNLTGLTFSANYTVTLTLPEGVRIISPNAVQNGRTVTIKFSAAISPSSPIRLYVQLTNPLLQTLSTGSRSFVTNIVTTQL